MDLLVDVNPDEGIKPSGAGILNAIFYARSQHAESEEQKNLKEIQDAFYEISSGYQFDVILGKNRKLSLNFSKKGQPWRPAKDCGLGLQDLLVIVFFCKYPEYDLILIEEPESHIHPDMQRKLCLYLNSCKDKQFILSTHSNIFLDDAMIDKVYHVQFTEAIEATDVTTKAGLLNELGYSVADNISCFFPRCTSWRAQLITRSAQVRVSLALGECRRKSALIRSNNSAKEKGLTR